MHVLVLEDPENLVEQLTQEGVGLLKNRVDWSVHAIWLSLVAVARGQEVILAVAPRKRMT